ncbi:MAG TPA: uracil-DNA glycosylase [Anaerolineae bacterium]|nr:uracil-DNA glycosylase [Anaerolineae bacterium]
MSDQQARLEALAEEVKNLTASPLYAYRVENNYHSVIGEGAADANIMFIGEAPGENEAKQGRPFVGAAGRVLSDLLASIGLKREEVYITNIVKDRPPDNRDPRKGELALYAPFLQRQIDIIRPKVIVPLGRFSMDFILAEFNVPEQGQKIGALHGQVLQGTTPYGPIAVVPLYHPAAAFYNQGLQNALREDFQALKQFV